LVYSLQYEGDPATYGSTLGIITLVVLAICSIEVAARVIGFGLRNFCHDIWASIDAIVVVAAWIILLTTQLLQLDHLSSFSANVLRTVSRSVWLARLVRLRGRLRQLLSATKARVSQNSQRFFDIENNIDLDLTYITHNLIAMSVPCMNPVHSLYRNPLWQVTKFIAIHHRDKFCVYNACPEMPYPDEPFEAVGGRVVHLRIQDHMPPTMQQFIEFLQDVREMLSKTNDGVIIVHCRGGKGRTGSLCCALLLFSKRCKDAAHALRHFAKRRTDENLVGKPKGVETPSQIRYVKQLAWHLDEYQAYVDSPFPPPFCAAPSIRLQALDFEGGLMARPQKMRPLKVLVQSGGINISELCLETRPYDPNLTSIPLDNVEVSGDVRVSVFQDTGGDLSAVQAMTLAANPHKAKGLVLLFIFHTNFMRQLSVQSSLDQEPSDYIQQAAKHCAVPDKRGKYKIAVEDLDVANRRIKSGYHAAGSSVILKYSSVARDLCSKPQEVFNM